MNRSKWLTVQALGILFAAVVCCLPEAGEAGNSRAFFLGDEAAMTGGAGVAVSRDSGSIWYNPAGLGGLHFGRMELTATAYKLKIRRIEDFIVADLPGGTLHKDMSVNSFGAVPTSVVFVRNLNEDISYGLAIYQTGNLSQSVRIEIDESLSVGRWGLGIEDHEVAVTYHIGPAIGWQITPRLRVGASLFVIYDSYTQNQQEFLSLSVSDSSGQTDYSYLWSLYYDAASIGFMIQAGLQWEFVENWHAALVLRSPTMNFHYSENEIVYDLTIDEDFEDESFGDQEAISEWDFDSGPDMETQIGLAYKTDKFWIAAEAAFRPPANEYEDWLWNASLGSRFQVTKTINMGAGVFTDRSKGLEPTYFLEESTDRYGISLGLENRTPVTVKKEGGDTSLEWTTTLAVIYSFEIGQVGSLAFDSESFGEVVLTDVLFHQVFLHLGTALYF